MGKPSHHLFSDIHEISVYSTKHYIAALTPVVDKKVALTVVSVLILYSKNRILGNSYKLYLNRHHRTNTTHSR